MSGQGLDDQEAADVIAWLSDAWGPIKLVARPDGTPDRVAPAAADEPSVDAPAAEQPAQEPPAAKAEPGSPAGEVPAEPTPAPDEVAK